MFENYINNAFVSKNDRIAVGVSGGADSMLLLWSMIDKQKEIGFFFEVINVNHKLRSKDSDNDSLFVENFCKKRKIPVKIIETDVKKLKNDKKMTLEESARVARYDIFKKVMKEDKLNKLFLAHHKNDQAETILMHIFRGSGIGGAAGIKNSDFIFRPLLDLTKCEILKIAKEHSIEFVEDKTNNDNEYSRNYVRNIILPEIEKVYPSAVKNIAQFGKKCGEIQDFILSLIDENLFELKKVEVILKQGIFTQKMFIVNEYLRIAFSHLGIFADIEEKHIKLICDLNFSEVNKEISLPHKCFAKKTYSGIKIFKKQNNAQSLNYEFVKNGKIEFNEYFNIITKTVSPSEVVYGEGFYVDANKISTEAMWRTRRLGDKFVKLGTGSKKFNDYLTNCKIDFELRDKLPVLAVGDSVLVFASGDVSENVKLDGSTDEIVKIVFERL